MKRLVAFLLCSSILGILTYEHNINPLYLCSVLLSVSFFCSKKEIRTAVLLSAVVLMCTFCRISLLDSQNTALGFEDVVDLRGVVDSFPVVKDDYVKFTLKLEEPKGEKVQAFVYDNSRDYYYGDNLEFTGKVKRPDEKRNPGGFDYRKYLKGRNIEAVIYIDGDSVHKLNNSNSRSITKLGRVFRQDFLDFLDNNFVDEQEEFVRGLTIGEKAMNPENANNFNKLGISHIVSVSGLHVGYVYFVISGICDLFRLGKLGKFTITSVLLYIYSFIVGFSSPVMRASLTLLLWMFAQFTNKKFDSINGICLVALAFLMYNPYLFYDVGFQLSYSAVLSITIIYPYLKNKVNVDNELIQRVIAVALLTISIQLGTLPLVLHHFNSISLLSTVANLLVVPLAGFIIIACFSLYFAGLLYLPVNWFVIPVKLAVEWCLKIPAFLSDLPFGFFRLPSMHWTAVIAYYSIILVSLGYFYTYKWKNRKIFIALTAVNTCVALFIFMFPKPLTVTFLDVGQGDSAIIECPGDFNVLVDGGGQADYKVGENVVLKALYNKNIRSLDLVVCTHSHDDHKLGIIEIMDDVEIKGIIINCVEEAGYADLIEAAQYYEIPVYRNHQVKIDLSDDLRLDFIYPDEGTRHVDENNSSVVTKLVYKRVSFLFMGDLEREGESLLLRGGADLDCDVIKLGHHGSETSTSCDFLEEVTPKYAIISVGDDNYYGHPSKKVLKLLGEKEVEVYRTDLSGAVEVKTYGEEITIREYVKEGEYIGLQTIDERH